MSIAVVPADAPEIARSPGAAAEATMLRRALLLLVGAELLLLYAPTGRWLVDRWTMSVWHNAHGFMIPPAVAWFAWQELRPLRALPREGNAWGLVFLIPALLMHVLDTGMHTQILSAASIVVALPGLALLFLGTQRTKAIGFPLAFTVFMLPIPLAVTEPLHLFLRHLATAGAAYAVPLMGITVFTEGTSIHLKEGILFVGDGCSGFSTLYAAVAVAALTAYSCNYTRGRLMALAAAVPAAVLANMIRIVLLVLAVRWLGVESLDTWIHPASGMLTFALALPLILWLGKPLPSKAAR
jgi:exosortase